MCKEFKTAVLIVAAGKGSRMGQIGKNKVFLNLLDKPILERSIAAFQASRWIDEIIVAVGPDEVEFCRREILELDTQKSSLDDGENETREFQEKPGSRDTQHRFSKVKAVIAGGVQRQDTVMLALEAVERDMELVLVHDGARPLIDGETIERTVKATAEHGAAAVGVRVKDTIKIEENGFIKETPDRSLLWAMQTPQGAKIEFLKAAMADAKKNGFYGTDEAVLLEKIGKKVFIVEGKYGNIKVTTSEDISIAENLLRQMSNVSGI